MGVYDFWTHGASVQVEYPDRIQYIRRCGDGTVIRQKHGTWNWFHFAIPTPTIINNARPKYDVAYLKARTGNRNIQGIQSWPTEAFISEIGFLDMGKIAHEVLGTVANVYVNCGAEPFGINKKLPEKEPQNGLVMCVRVEFKPDPASKGAVGEILFFGAGARFKV